MMSRGIVGPTFSVWLLLLSSAGLSSAFTFPKPFLTASSHRVSTSSSSALETALYMGKSRKARRMDQQQVTKSRPQQFLDAMDEAEGKEPSRTSPPPKKGKKD
eukprot:scaffold5790_cov76-Amphora_coffeaeformis.AAC.1